MKSITGIRRVEYTLPGQPCGCRKKYDRILTIPVPREAYLKRAHQEARPTNTTYVGMRQYARPDPPLDLVVNHLLKKVLKEEKSDGGNCRLAFVEDVLDFVAHNVEYQRSAPNGYRVRFPVETLVEKQGHCLDSCLLTATMLALGGVATGILEVEGKSEHHVMLGVHCSSRDALPVHLVKSGSPHSGVANRAFERYVRERQRRKGGEYLPVLKVKLDERLWLEYDIDDQRLLNGFPTVQWAGDEYAVIEMTYKNWRMPNYLPTFREGA